MRKDRDRPTDSKRAPNGAKSKDATIARKRARQAKRMARGNVR